MKKKNINIYLKAKSSAFKQLDFTIKYLNLNTSQEKVLRTTVWKFFYMGEEYQRNMPKRAGRMPRQTDLVIECKKFEEGP